MTAWTYWFAFGAALCAVGLALDFLPLDTPGGWTIGTRMVAVLACFVPGLLVVLMAVHLSNRTVQSVIQKRNLRLPGFYRARFLARMDLMIVSGLAFVLVAVILLGAGPSAVRTADFLAAGTPGALLAGLGFLVRHRYVTAVRNAADGSPI